MRKLPEGYICNLVDDWNNGGEVMRTIKNMIMNQNIPLVIDIVEEAAGLRKGALKGYVQCMAPMLWGEYKVGDLIKEYSPRGTIYFLLWNEMTAIEVLSEAEYRYTERMGGFMN